MSDNTAASQKTDTAQVEVTVGYNIRSLGAKAGDTIKVDAATAKSLEDRGLTQKGRIAYLEQRSEQYEGVVPVSELEAEQRALNAAQRETLQIKRHNESLRKDNAELKAKVEFLEAQLKEKTVIRRPVPGRKSNVKRTSG